MDRRQFLQGGLGAAIIAPLVADMATAQARGQAPASGRGQGPAPAPTPVAAAARKLVIDAHSRNLHWLRTADEVAQAAVEIVAGGVCPTVLPAPGHINPARVAQELPAFVTRIRNHGLRVVQIKGPAITDLTDANAEVLVGTAAQAGLTHYSLTGFTYDLARPLQPQLDTIKTRLDRLVRLNQKHRMTLVYEPLTGRTAVGANILDLLPVMRGFDPRYIGFQWDTGNMGLHGDGMWEPLMRLAGPYIATIGWRDRGWVQDLGLLGEGGPYRGPYPRVEPLVTRPDGSAVPGTPAPARGAGPAAGGAPAAGGGGARGGRGGGGDEGDAPAPRGGGAGRGAARGPANSAGAGSIDDANPLYDSKDGSMPKRPIGGKNAKGAGWSAENIAMGMGVVHIPQVASVLASIGFNGPSSLQSEYSGMGGAENGADRINRPRQWVIGMLKRDVITIRKSFEMANAGVAI